MVENILKIIDSKVQYLIYELNQKIKTENETIFNEANSLDEIFALMASQPSNEKNSTILLEIEITSSTVNKLLTLRNLLTRNNYEMIYNLLCENHFEEFSSLELKFVVEGKRANEVG